MADTNELARVAAAMSAVRPDWPQSSLFTFLTKNHADRPYRDLLIAAVAVASDETTQTPALLNQHGVWWQAAYVAGKKPTPVVGAGREPRCSVDGHEYWAARNCPGCRSEAIARPDEEDR